MDARDHSASLDALAADMGWVRQLARSLLRDPADADDVAQEVWLEAAEHPPASADRTRGWLSVVTRHVVQRLGRSDARRKRREEFVARAESDSRPDDVIERGDTCRRLVETVMSLDEPHRSTVLRRYLDGSTTKEIAVHDGITEAAVRKRISRALQELRVRLDAEYEGGSEAWMAALLRLDPGTGSAALTTTGFALGGLLAMKKLLVAVVVLLVVCGLIFLSPLFDELRGTRGNVRSTDTALAVAPAPPSEPDPAPITLGERASVAPAVESPAAPLSVDGVVMNLPLPGSALAPHPAVGVAVHAALVSTMMDPTPVRSQTTTGPDGRFHIELADPQKRPQSISINVEGDEQYRSKSAMLEIKDQSPIQERDIERVMHGDLHGVVVDEAGAPVPGATVQVQRSRFGPQKTEAPLQVFTDPAGEFTLENFNPSGSANFSVSSPGLRMMRIGPAVANSKGGWNPVRLAMTKTGGRCTARVVDGEGRPVAEVSVRLELSNAEPGARFEPWQGYDDTAARGVTDAEGRVAFDDVWLDKQLVLTLSSKLGSWSRERSAAGRIDLREKEVGSALVARAPTPLELEIVVPVRQRIRGQVSAAPETKVTKAFVKVRPRGPVLDDVEFPPSIKTDEAGKFELETWRTSRPYTVEFRASADGKDADGRNAKFVGRASVEISPDGPTEVVVAIELQPALLITGTARDAEGHAIAGSVVAIPSLGFEGENSLGVGAAIAEDGSFFVENLSPGPYDLEVRPKKNFVFTQCLLAHRFERIEAGSRDVALVVGEADAANVEIEVAAADGVISRMAVIIGRHYSYSPRDPQGHVPPGEQKFAGTSGWPEGATLDFGGQTGASDDSGTTAFLHLGAESPLHRIQPLSPGWYGLGVDAWDEKGVRYHPCGTGLVYLAAGSYRFHFDLVRRIQVEGTITSATARDDLSVGLFDADGKAVQVMRTSRHVGDFVRVADSGRFAIEGAPVGKFRLRVGTEAQLAAGEFLHEREVVVVMDQTEPIAIDLP